MKLNESNLADPLLISGCGLNSAPWGGSFGGQDIISTTTFSDDALLLPPQGGGNPTGVTGLKGCLETGSAPTLHGTENVELDALLVVQSGNDGLPDLKPLPPFEFAMGGAGGAGMNQLTLHSDPSLPQMTSETCSPNSTSNPPNTTSSANNNAANINGSSNRINGVPRSSFSPPGTNPTTGSFGGSPNIGSPGSLFDPVSSSTSIPANIKSELADYLLNSDIDDIAALIGNAIADSTVPNPNMDLDPNAVTSSTMDPWTELDAWIESACQQQQLSGLKGNNSLLDQDATIHTSGDSPFIGGNNVNNVNINTSQNNNNNNNTSNNNASALQALLDSTDPGGGFTSPPHGLFPPDIKPDFQTNSILQTRLQQPNQGTMMTVNTTSGSSPTSQLPESTTPYGLKVDPYTLNPGSPYGDHMNEIQRPHTTHLSPPQVTSTMMNNNPSNRYRKNNFNNRSPKHGYQSSAHGNTFLPPFGSTYDHSASLLNQVGTNGKLGMKTKRKSAKLGSEPGLSLGSSIDNGKEKPIHRCGVCNRGFLNKSNIKVHLRTHTGEKPFKCETCGKAFRQKAHLLKHIQIHKRIPRD